MKQFFVLFFLFSITTYSQQNLGYNRENIVFPGCEKEDDLETCFESKLLKYVDTSLTKSSVDKIIRLSKKDTISVLSNLYFDEKGTLLQKMSGFNVFVDSLKSKDFKYLEASFPKVLPVLDNYNKGVADHKNLLLGFKINRVDNTLSPIENYIPEEVPFSVIEQVPLYKGCTLEFGPEIAKKCMTNRIAKHVHKNFNTNLAASLDLEPGIKRIFIAFKVDKQANIVDILARAPHPALESEAKRIIRLIPQFDAPGMQKGKAVIVPYAMPIAFKIEETTAQKRERKRLKRINRNN